jgi:hypothetical protein
MDSEQLTKISDSIKEKLGEESAALIADDLGILITQNKEVQDLLQKQEDEITTLKDTNEKLVLANGNLLKQVPMGKAEEEPKAEEPKKSFNFSDMFDEHGNFKK